MVRISQSDRPLLFHISLTNTEAYIKIYLYLLTTCISPSILSSHVIGSVFNRGREGGSRHCISNYESHLLAARSGSGSWRHKAALGSRVQVVVRGVLAVILKTSGGPSSGAGILVISPPL